jgi:2-polyprenyl-3-methyl-5-hydroxy-6-metoxy-1,4-benzoquinol methylase
VDKFDNCRDKRAFDRLQNYQGIRDAITQYIPRSNAIILNIGCGTSKLPEEMYNEGYKFIINIDKSQECITHMRSQYPKMPKTFQYLKMDALEMDFGREVFTTVFDKGLLDSICVGRLYLCLLNV